jgi:type II secretory pathway component PulL
MKTGFIDWTENTLHVYVFQKKADHYKLIDSSTHPLEGELDEETLKSLPADDCDNIFLSIPLSTLTLREQEFPFSDRDKIRDTIPFELEGILLGDISDYSIDHIITESYDISSKVLAACIEKSRLRQIIDMFSSADLEPRVITSLDLQLSEGKSEALIGDAVSDSEVRMESAGKEITEPSINLRQGDLAYMGDVENLIRKLRVTAVLVLIFLIVLAANSAFRLTTLKNENSLMAGEIQKVYRRVFPEDKKIIDADRQFKGNMKRLIEKKAALEGIPVLDILQDVAVQNNRKITLTEFNVDGNNLVIKGTAQSFEDVETLKNDFAPLFADVKVTDSDATADKKINFTIVMHNKKA